jgi:hypothetical protein
MEWLFQFEGLTPEGALATLATMQPTSKFGEAFQYSNLLAGAAGFVAGHVLFPKLELGAAYDKAIQAEVFDPLGMKSTTFDYKRALAGNHAGPHAPDIDGKAARAGMELNYSILPLRPAGAAWSNVRDMLKYVAMELAEGKLPNGKRYVAKEPLLARRQPKVPISKDATYGMGLIVDRTYGVPVVHHGGNMIGFYSDMIWLPEQQVGAVTITRGCRRPAFRPRWRVWVGTERAVVRRCHVAILSAAGWTAPSLLVDWLAEPQVVSVGIRDIEVSHAVAAVLDRTGHAHSGPLDLRPDRVGVVDCDVAGTCTSRRVSSLEVDLHAIALDDRVRNLRVKIIVKLERAAESEAPFEEGQRSPHVCHMECRAHVLEHGSILAALAGAAPIAIELRPPNVIAVGQRHPANQSSRRSSGRRMRGTARGARVLSKNGDGEPAPVSHHFPRSLALRATTLDSDELLGEVGGVPMANFA